MFMSPPHGKNLTTPMTVLFCTTLSHVHFTVASFSLRCHTSVGIHLRARWLTRSREYIKEDWLYSTVDDYRPSANASDASDNQYRYIGSISTSKHIVIAASISSFRCISSCPVFSERELMFMFAIVVRPSVCRL